MRVVIFVASESSLNFALRGRRDAAITSDWPDDAKIIGGEWNLDKRQMRLMVESASFDEVLIGDTVPEWRPTFTAYAVEPSARSIMDLIDKMHEEELDEAAAGGLRGRV